MWPPHDVQYTFHEYRFVATLRIALCDDICYISKTNHDVSELKGVKWVNNPE